MVKAGAGTGAVVFLLAGTLGISTAFGMVLLLPLYVQELGGDEASFGVILSSATLPAMLCIGALIRHPEAVRPTKVVALAIGAYAAGTIVAASITDSWLPLIGVGVLLGTAWAVVYTATPMVMSEMVTDASRATYFGYLTGTQQVGIGAGPVVAEFLVDNGIGVRGIFLLAAAICAVAVTSTLFVGSLISDARAARQVGRIGDRDGGDNDARPGSESTIVGFGAALRRIAGSEAAFSLVMVLLFACLFTSMTQFQTTFATTREMDYSIYYIAYTAAVIFSRFVVARIAGRLDPRLVISISVSVMALAIASFLLIGSSEVLYGLAASALGFGYGLALPMVQAQAVNVSEQSVRSRVLPLAGLCFQTAILAFPLVAGTVIAGFGYDALFAMLVGLAVIQVAISWWQWLKSRTTRHMDAPSAG